MSDPFIGEIRLFGQGAAPNGWAQCDGSALLISQNAMLYSLIGEAFGQSQEQGQPVKRVTVADSEQAYFSLPDLRGRVPLGTGAAGDLPGARTGTLGGEEFVTLYHDTMPTHSHQVNVSSSRSNTRHPADNILATNISNPYSMDGPGSKVAMSPAGVPSFGTEETAGHPNMQPYLTMNFCIALRGRFPQEF